MGKIIEYEHHGSMVSVDEDLKGKHREHCLCFRCALFFPGTAANCPIAQRLFELCQEFNVTAPMYECARFLEGSPYLEEMR